MNKFNVGDKVIVCDSPQPNREIWWDIRMNDTCGKVGTVCEILDEDLMGVALRFENTGDMWSYHYDWISPYNESEYKQEQKQSNKYLREIKPNVFVDVYDVLGAFEVNDPCLSHLAKKALCAGLRGHKSRIEDLLDIKASIERAIERHKEWNND